MRQLNLPALALTLACFLVGCAGPNLQDRIHQKYSVYQSLSPEVRQAVDQGKVQVGMPMDAVYIAWGKPDQTVQGGSSAGETVTWLYEGGYVTQARYWGYRHMYTQYIDVAYVRAEVTFVSGKVVQWRTFPHPAM